MPPFGKNQVVYDEELFSGQIGQIGTQYDAFGHAGVHVDGENLFFNGFIRREFRAAGGLQRLGVEKKGEFHGFKP